MPLYAVDHLSDVPPDPAVRVKIAQQYRKSSGNYYTFLIYFLQAVFELTFLFNYVFVHFLLAQAVAFFLQSTYIRRGGIHCNAA